MPTREQIETALVNADKAGDVQAARTLANALKYGEYDQGGMLSKAKDFATNLVNPPKEDIPEAPYIYQGGGERELEMYRQAVDPTAQATQDQHGNTVWEGRNGRVYPDQPGFTLRDIPQFQSDATDFLVDAAPEIAGGAAVAGLRWPGAAVRMAGVGATSAAAREGTEELLAGNGDISAIPRDAALAWGGEVGARVLFGALGPLLGRMFGKEASSEPLVTNSGQLTDHAVSLLERARSTENFDEILDAELAKLTRQGALSPEEAKRFNQFAKYGLEPTKAQVTRKATDFQNQQEALKRSGAVRNALEGQDVSLRNQFEQLKPAQEPLTERKASQAMDFITGRVTEADEAVTAAYRAAREAAPDAKNIRMDGLLSRINSLSADDAATNGMISSIRGELQRQGVTGNSRISVDQAEKVRQHINRLGQSTTDYGRGLARELKDALDEDVARVAGDYFSEARGLKRGLESGLDRARRGRRDQRSGRGLLRDIVENRVNPDDMVAHLRRDSVRADDLGELKSWLQNEGGDTAWLAVKRDIAEDIIGRTFKGAEGERGVPVPTRAKLEAGMNRWGRDKLAQVFTEDEMGFLDDMAKLLKYREPVTGTQQGRGPSAQGMMYAADNLIRRIPYVGGFSVDLLKGVLDIANESRMTREALENLAQRTGRQLTNAQMKALRESIVRSVRPAGGVAGGSAIAVAEQ